MNTCNYSELCGFVSGRRIVKENLTYTVSETLTAPVFWDKIGDKAKGLVDSAKITYKVSEEKSKLSEPLTGAFPVAGGNMGTNVHTSRKAAGHPSYDSIYIMKGCRSNHGREKDSDL